MSALLDRVTTPLVSLRTRVRGLHGGTLIWRIGVFIVGLLFTVGGLALIPLPGPGWVIVFLGLSIWGTEFAWAQRLLTWAKDQLSRFTEWTKRQPLWLRAVGAVLTLAVVAAVVAAYAKWQGWWPFNG